MKRGDWIIRKGDGYFLSPPNVIGYITDIDGVDYFVKWDDKPLLCYSKWYLQLISRKLTETELEDLILRTI